MIRRIFSFLFFAFCLHVHAAGPYGADNGWAIDDSGNPYVTPAVAAALSHDEIGWLRVEMRLIPGHSSWDGMMLGYYDTVVSNAHNAGIQVFLLIDNSSVSSGGQSSWNANNYENNPAFNGDNDYVENFASNGVAPIVQHFHDRVKYYEIWNEPNAWTSSPSNGVYTGGSFIYPSIYGWLLARSWEMVHQTDHLNDVILFSGGVFGHNIGGVTSYANAGAQYIDDTYSTGTNTRKGGSFAYTKSNYNAYPLDGIGEHLYISQGGIVSGATFRQYLDWVRQAYTKYEGAGTPKMTFITEFAWQTTNAANSDGVSQAVQDTNLVISFNAIAAAPYVQMAVWFSVQDSTAAGLYFGIFDTSGNPKLALPDYQRAHRFEGVYADGSTNTAIYNYFGGAGQAALGNPYNNGSNWWVYALGNGYAQDFDGGAHLKLMVMASSNGVFEVNDRHGFRDAYATHFGFPLDNEFAAGSGVRQDFTAGYLAWDSTNQAVWHSGTVTPVAPASLVAAPSNALVALSWPGDPAAMSYNVKRTRTSGSSYATIAAAVMATNYVDSGLTNGVTYYYVVSGTNALGESGNSPQASALPVAPPHFLTQPVSATVNQGTGFTLGVSTASSVTPSYQWELNGSTIPGATGSSYTVSNAVPVMAGTYSVLAANYGGTSVSSNATVAIRPLMSASQNPGATVLRWDGSFILQASTNVAGPFQDLTNAASPFTNPFAWPQQFFRLHQ